MSRAPPIRSDSAPAIGATNIGIAVHGRMRRPEPKRRVALHRLEELREQEDRAEHPEEHEQRRDVRERERAVAEEAHRQHRRLGAQLPQRRTARRARAPTASEPTISGHVQPCALPRTRPQTMPNRPALTSARPGRSSFAFGPVASPRAAGARAGRARARSARSARRSSATRCRSRRRRRRAGRTRRRGRRCRPRRRARRRAAPPARRRTRIVSVSGVTIAPPTPCTARAAIERAERRRERRRGRGER